MLAAARICTKTTTLIFPVRLQGGMDNYRSARPFAVNALATAEPSLTAEAASGIDRSVRPKQAGYHAIVWPIVPWREAIPSGKFKPLALGQFQSGADS